MRISIMLDKVEQWAKEHGYKSKIIQLPYIQSESILVSNGSYYFAYTDKLGLAIMKSDADLITKNNGRMENVTNICTHKRTNSEYHELLIME